MQPITRFPNGYYQYSFSWQQQLPYNLTSTVAYVGSQGHNLFLRSVANQILPGQHEHSSTERISRRASASSTD